MTLGGLPCATFDETFNAADIDWAVVPRGFSVGGGPLSLRQLYYMVDVARPPETLFPPTVLDALGIPMPAVLDLSSLRGIG
jgi:hypothetical protein